LGQRLTASARHGAREETWGKLVKILLGLLTTGFVLAACAGTEPAPSKRAVLVQMLATSAQLFVQREGNVKRSGSGVILSTDLPEGRVAIITTAHLLEPPVAQSAYVVAGTKRERIPADIVAVDTDRDLALVTASVAGVSEAALAGGAELADEILIVAFPWGRERTVVNGAVSQIAAQASIEDPLSISGPVGLVDATVSYGMSGGGVFDRGTGQLVGLVRGYRTAHLSLSSQDTPLKLPIAGETTVISTRDMVCFLRSIGYEGLIANSAAAAIPERDCATPR
jgi:S1-C subfamily serine protease